MKRDTVTGDVIVALSVVILTLFFAPLIGVLLGTFAGWVVSLFCNDWVHQIISGIFPSLANYSLAQIGGGLGFLSAFIKPSASSSLNKKD